MPTLVLHLGLRHLWPEVPALRLVDVFWMVDVQGQCLARVHGHGESTTLCFVDMRTEGADAVVRREGLERPDGKCEDVGAIVRSVGNDRHALGERELVEG